MPIFFLHVKAKVGKLRLWLLQQDVPPHVDPKYAVIQDDGSFEIKGDGSGIEAGKYTVCVVWQQSFPQEKTSWTASSTKRTRKYSERSPKTAI